MNVEKKYGQGAELIWSDRKRFLGLPLSFTRYRLVRKPGSWVKVFVDTGFISSSLDEINVYRICDIGFKQSLLGRMFNYGTVILYSSDASKPTLHLVSIKDPHRVRDMFSSLAEEQRRLNNIKVTEFHSHF